MFKVQLVMENGIEEVITDNPNQYLIREENTKKKINVVTVKIEKIK